MRYIIVYVLFLAGIVSCKKEKEVDVSDALTEFTIDKKEVLADGLTTVNVRVDLTNKSSADRRTVLFTSTSGVFTISGSNKQSAKAEFVDGHLIAKATLRVSTQPGNIIVSVQPEFDSPIKEFIISDSFKTLTSIPATISIEPSSFGLAGNFLNEILIVGVLKNSANKYVSKGAVVVFEDFLDNGDPANGQFRNLSDVTGDSSRVSGYYSAQAYPIGTVIKIRSTVLDSIGNTTSISDSILLTINE